MRTGENPKDYVAFYDQMVEEEYAAFPIATGVEVRSAQRTPMWD